MSRTDGSEHKSSERGWWTPHRVQRSGSPHDCFPPRPLVDTRSTLRHPVSLLPLASGVRLVPPKLVGRRGVGWDTPLALIGWKI